MALNLRIVAGLVAVFLISTFAIFLYFLGLFSPLTYPIPAVRDTMVYVANFGNNTVSVIDSNKNAVVATIHVGAAPESVQISADRKWVYVADYGSNTVSVINTSTNRIVKNILVGVQPTSISINPNGKQIYVINYNISINPVTGSGEIGKSTISVINTSTDLVTNTISFNLPTSTLRIDSMAITPNGTKLYLGGDYEVVNKTAERAVWVVNIRNMSAPQLLMPTQIEYGGSNMLLISSNSGKYIYGTYGGSNFFSINTKNNTILPIKFGAEHPYVFSLAISPDDKYLYASDAYIGQGHFAASLDILNMSNNSTRNINLNSMGQMAVVNDNLVYVTDYYGDSVILLNTSSGVILNKIGVGSEPISIALEPFGLGS
jgi:YVTN family beta-propeller protein